MTTETKPRALPAAVILTPGAEARIADLMRQAPEGAIGVKLSTPGLFGPRLFGRLCD
jgi:iron-sulfur cluster assembly protein